MQSAFVDIGLDRDAFLYVSDFMDLEQQDEDLDEAIPANRPMGESRPRPGLETDAAPHDSYAASGNVAVPGEAPAAETAGQSTESSRDFRGRRRRRGRRGDQGERLGRGANTG